MKVNCLPSCCKTGCSFYQYTRKGSISGSYHEREAYSTSGAYHGRRGWSYSGRTYQK